MILESSKISFATVTFQERLLDSLHFLIKKYFPNSKIVLSTSSCTKRIFNNINNIVPTILFKEVGQDKNELIEFSKNVNSPYITTIYIGNENDYEMAFSTESILYSYINVNNLNNRFVQTIETALVKHKKLINFKEQTILVRARKKTVLLKENEIKYIEAQGSKSDIYIHNNNTINTNQNLKVLENLLSPFSFFRVRRNWLINVKHLDSIDEKHANMIDGTKIPLSKIGRRDLIKHIENSVNYLNQ